MSWDLVKAGTEAIASAENSSIRGTGFFISSVGHLLTCAYVVEASSGGLEKVRVQGQPVSLVYLGDRWCDDFAIVQVMAGLGEAVPLSRTFELPLKEPEFLSVS